jgi:aspartate/methionine/tyrosine aminotransferase
MFPPLAYLQWIEGRPAAAEHDLGSSDLRRLPAGDPDEPVPPRLRGLSPPTGDASLRERVAGEYDLAESNVLLTAGATHGGFLACATATALARERAAAASAGSDPAGSVPNGAAAPDDDGPRPCALVENPGYEPLVETPHGLGSRVARFRRPGPDAQLDPERVAAAVPDLMGPLAHVTVTNRHNPTGTLTSRETLAETATATADHGGYLLVDEVYAPYTVDGGEGSAFGGPTGAGLPATVTVGSLTKFHGLGGLRVGWITGPEAFIERASQVEQHVPVLAAPSGALARRFFAHRDDLVADARDHCHRNHELLAGFLDERDDIDGVVNSGSPFAYIEHERVDGDALSAAAWDAGVLVIPGRFFGMDDGVRVSLGRSPDECDAALAAFGRVLDGL